MFGRRYSRQRKRAAVGVVIAGAVVSLVATAGAAQSRPAARAAKAPVPVRGGNLVVAVDQESSGFDPGHMVNGVAGRVIQSGLFATLAAPTAKGQDVPFIAQSITPNTTGTVWTVTLRPGLKFADGTPLNAQAVKFDMDRQLLPTASTYAATQIVKNIKVVNPLTLKFTTKIPFGAFPALLEGQFSYFASPKAYRTEGAKAFSTKPVGNGPYGILQSWVLNDHLTLKRNPYYFRKDAGYLNSVTFRVIPNESARVAALEAGDVNVMWTVNADDIKTLYQNPLFKHYVETKAIGTDGIVMNTSKPPFNDLRVREALAYALNRKELVNVAFGGIGGVANTPFDKTSPYAVKVNYPNYDPAKAKSLLQAYEKATGTSVSFTLNCTTDSSYEKLAQLIQQQWDAIGAHVTVVPVDQNTLFADGIKGTYDADVWPHPGFIDPDGWMYNFYYSSSGLNIAKYKNPTLDKLILQGRESTKFAVRKKAYAGIQRLLAQQLPWIYIRHEVFATFADKWVHGINKWTLPSGTPGYYGQEINVPFSVANIWMSKH